MRITVAIEDELHITAKQAARRRGYSLGRLIEDALRRELGHRRGIRPPELPVFRGGALVELVEPARAGAEPIELSGQ
ncbi:MAG TPA: hypothetical protein VE953_21620 [Terriglobales bacterium]|nr:hypothetical protein [Terriglobales bacterium]